MCEKLLFTLFFTIHMPWCNVYVSLTVHQTLVLKKKKNTQTCQNVEVNVDPNPHIDSPIIKNFIKKNPRLIPSLIKQT